MQYTDLIGGQKPHLLTAYVNSTGSETHLEYTTSTSYTSRTKQQISSGSLGHVLPCTLSVV